MAKIASYWTSLLLVIVAAAVATVPAAAAPGRESQEQLLQVLQSGPPQEKALACKKLAVCGTKDAVPALAALLADEQLASWARIALEAIPDKAADESLRESLGKLKGKLLVGAINSIGVRRDAGAVAVLAARLGDADADVAGAAAVALGHIGGQPAAKALEAALASAPAPVRSAVAEGCILCAEQFLAAGGRAEAVKLYDAVRKSAELPQPRILEATRGAILARQFVPQFLPEGMPLWVDLLRSKDKRLFALGLQLARELPGQEATDALAAELASAAPDRQPLLMAALADRGGPAAQRAVLQAAKTGSGPARIAAIRALAKLGDAASVLVLLEGAASEAADVSCAAVEVLAEVPGKDVDAVLAARMGDAHGKARLVLLELAGKRCLVGAVPALLKAADDPDAQVRMAALAALGQTAGMEELPRLIARAAASAGSPEEAKAAVAALDAACVRMADRDACAEKLIAAMPQASTPVKCRSLAILHDVGGGKALAAVAAAAKGSEPDLQDAATRALGEWMGPDAAPALVDLARTSADAKYQARALRGYIRIARQFNHPLSERMRMSSEALSLCRRDEERKLVIQVLEHFPATEGLATLVSLLPNAAVRHDAGAAAVTIGEKLLASNPAAVAEAMRSVAAADVGRDVVGRAQALLEKAVRRSGGKQ